ncbi:hypothetical protein ACSXBA_10700 [Clostridium perfringens]|uniref:Uncharacterized protein n=1 Tax=Clostridium perfringens TaxID=1502 RepID=A0A0N7BKK2_CLOPF|nr:MULTISPECIES: hypothetical protein [Clostridium]AKF16572.1 hypothetical protein [Clostridium perfringens]AMN35166.1 hypothetical protein JFP838_05165 [Clostridium perfringens]EIL8447029.1 hypothetical protein [Clostridium perfringens]ELC8392657.1 hypothetical protein [Clostridium perfringens]MBO3421705.1 hypothetical protein [Clostridium perfringens]
MNSKKEEIIKYMEEMLEDRKKMKIQTEKRIEERLDFYKKCGLDIYNAYVKKAIDSEKELLDNIQKQCDGYQIIIDGINKGTIRVGDSE